jgi:uncharacterized protein (DUF2384 family)
MLAPSMAGESRSRDERSSINAVRWAKAAGIFHAALDVTPDARAAFVRTACDDDNQLRDEVVALLASDEEAGDFIERPAASLLARRHPFAPRFSAGAALGRYEILEFLGAGGTSEVYRRPQAGHEPGR